MKKPRFRAANVVFVRLQWRVVSDSYSKNACQIGESQGRAYEWACDMHAARQTREWTRFCSFDSTEFAR